LQVVTGVGFGQLSAAAMGLATPLNRSVIPTRAEPKDCVIDQAAVLSESRILHAWLIQGDRDGASFLADVWQMLGRVAARGGGTLDAMPAETTQPDQRREYLAVVSGTQAEALLLLEVGVHRAQSVPAAPISGRIETSLVGVELLSKQASPATARPETPVLKTYSYVQGIVTHHPSGRTVPLSTMLMGGWDARANQ
jgi:protein subunit release factor A